MDGVLFSVDGVLAGAWMVIAGRFCGKRVRTGKRNRMRFFSPPCLCAVKCVLADHGSCGDSGRCWHLLRNDALFDSMPDPKKKAYGFMCLLLTSLVFVREFSSDMCFLAT